MKHNTMTENSIIPIVILNQAPEIKALVDQIMKASAETDKRIDEMTQMVKRIEKAHNETVTDLWRQVARTAGDQNLLPADYVHDKSHSIGTKNGVLVIKTKSDHGGGDDCDCVICSIARLIGGGPKP